VGVRPDLFSNFGDRDVHRWHTLRSSATHAHPQHAHRRHPEAYSKQANVQLRVARLRDRIAAPAGTILLALLATAAIVFVIASSNVANLILARLVRREGEVARYYAGTAPLSSTPTRGDTRVGF
jgi:hypothetical protein